MPRFFAVVLCAFLLCAFPLLVSAEILEEIVVTGSYIESDVPGTQIRRKGDNLLIRVEISNDSREEKQREAEIHETLRRAVESAKRIK